MTEDIQPYCFDEKDADFGSKVPSLTETSVDEAKRLVDEHWEYVRDGQRQALMVGKIDWQETILLQVGVDELLDYVGFHFKSSGIHFWKHALEWAQQAGLLKE